MNMKNINTNIVVLIVGAVLLCYGLLVPFIKSNTNTNPINHTPSVLVPLDPSLKDNCEKVVEILKSGSSDRTVDGVKLSGLFSDLARLIELDGDNEVIKNTDEIREANRIAGAFYNLDLKGKYTNLTQAATNVVVQHIGDDNVALDPELRKKAVEAFNGLAWACYEGSK
jgi:hypothetical protein